MKKFLQRFSVIFSIVFIFSTSVYCVERLYKEKDFSFSKEGLDFSFFDGLNINFEDFSITNQIQIIKFSFDRVTNSFNGNFFGKFFTKYHGISFVSSGSIFGIPITSGVFSIHFSFYAFRLDDGIVLARFTDYEDPQKKIEISVEDSKIVVYVNKLLFGFDGSALDFKLISDDRISFGRWVELSLVFDILNSKVVLYIDGIESDKKSFVDSSFALTSKDVFVEFFTDFFGYADDIMIVPTLVRTTKFPKVLANEYVSRIIDTRDFSSKIEYFRLVGGKGSFVVLARVSSDIFKLLSNEVDWKPLSQLNERGRYVQFKVLPIKVSEDFVIDFDYLEFSTSTLIKPVKPVIVGIQVKDYGEVVLQWRNELDDDIDHYEVYYGSFEDRYFGKDAINGVSPLKIKKPTKFYPIFSYTIKGLSFNKKYFFSIRSVRKDGTKSEYSDEVSVIPSLSSM
ncbi:MAG: fibronectin type III domain-containing protein [Brevinematia bacterium]